MAVIELDEDQLEAKVMETTLRYSMIVPEDVLANIMASGYFQLHNFTPYVRKQPLSPLWETFLTKIWYPTQQRVVELKAAGKLSNVKAERIAIATDGLKIKPFAWSNQSVSHHRAKKFLEQLEPIRQQEKGQLGRQWWPADVEGVIEAIKREQRRKQRLVEEDKERLEKAGTSCDPVVKGKVSTWLQNTEGAPGSLAVGGSSNSSSSSKRKSQASGPVAPGGQRTLVKSSSNKRDEDTWSTTAAPGGTKDTHTTSRGSSSSKASKRQRQSK